MNMMLTSDVRPEVEKWPFRACAVKISVVDAKGMQLYRMSHNSEFARREVYIASDIVLFCSSLCAHYEWM